MQAYLKRPVNAATGEDSQILVYATSWWNSQTAKKSLARHEQPIWTSLLVGFPLGLDDILFFGRCGELMIRSAISLLAVQIGQAQTDS